MRHAEYERKVTTGCPEDDLFFVSSWHFCILWCRRLIFYMMNEHTLRFF